MDEKNTNAYHIELDNQCILKLFIKDESKAQTIASQCNNILLWLGAPPGFKVYLWCIDWPRFIKKEEWPGRLNVNGGWAVPGINEIFVYREEEWDRVVIHEIIHALEWDWKMPKTPFKCWGFQENDTVYPHLFEAWTELYTEWLWTAWHEKSWNEQLQWMEVQALQILARQHNNTNWTENTNIFAYYVLKACLSKHIAFLLVFRNGETDLEKTNVLCGLVTPNLEKLKDKSKTIQPVDLSMRMSKGAPLRGSPFGTPLRGTPKEEAPLEPL